MNKMKIFVGGPITHLSGVNGFDKDFKEMVISVSRRIEEKGHKVLSAHIEEKFGEGRIEADNIIVARDLNWIDEADICLFLFPVDSDKSPVRTDGTYIELGYATAKKDVVHIFWNKQCGQNYSAMLRGMGEKKVQFYDFADIRKVIDSIG